VKEVFAWLWQDNNLVISIFFFFFLRIYCVFLTNKILRIITGHVPTEEITRNQKRPKKTSTNSTITREVFDGKYRKLLKIPLLIDCYNHYMNSVNVIN
jgi:hypothetical protein